MTSNEYLLQASQLGKVYPRAGEQVIALDSIDLSVKRGEYLAVMGCSGSGKTTLLNLLGGLERPTRGDVFFDGQSLGTMEEGRLARLRLFRIGYVYQDFCLISGLSALDNIRLPLYLSGKMREGSNQARALLEEVGLQNRATHFPRELSRGEMQRVSIARAVACDPELLLVDEPTGNLDEESSTRVQEILEKFCRQKGKQLFSQRTTRISRGRRIESLDFLTGACSQIPEVKQ